eukprot:1809676-Alexandrium_andersonii.AAC.1
MGFFDGSCHTHDHSGHGEGGAGWVLFGCMVIEHTWTRLAHGAIHLPNTTVMQAENTAYHEL